MSLGVVSELWRKVADYLLDQQHTWSDLLLRYCPIFNIIPILLDGVDRPDESFEATGRSGGPISPRQSLFPRGARKALLVGIDYKMSTQNEEFGVLDGPHQDVDQMREYLARLGFTDIVMMKDTPDAGELAPTRANLEREIKKFVEGTKPGDSLVFHYSGHCDQVDALRDQCEEDGKDEVIIPMDHRGLGPENRHLLLIDDDLRRLLVDPLPLNAKLTAIFDSCHSGTLLDLDHDKCNDVFPADRLFQIVRTATRVTSVFRRRIYTKTRIHPKVIQTRRLSIEMRPSADGSRHEGFIIESQVSTYETDSPVLSEPVGISRRFSTNGYRPSTRTLSLPRLNTEQRAIMTRRRCTGLCTMSPTIRQNVVSISACRDSQNTIEDDQGCSLSRALVTVLRQDQPLTYHELLHQLRCQANQTCIKMHDWYHESGYTCRGSPLTSPLAGVSCSRKCTASEKSFYTWQPQLASQKRLNLHDRFSLIHT